MTNANDNETNQLHFPYRLVDPEDHDTATALEILSSVRLKTAAYMNMRARGKEIPTSVVEAIKKGNAWALEVGQPPLLSDEDLHSLG